MTTEEVILYIFLAVCGYGVNLFAGHMYKDSSLWNSADRGINVMMAATILIPGLTGAVVLVISLITLIEALLGDE